MGFDWGEKKNLSESPVFFGTNLDWYRLLCSIFVHRAWQFSSCFSVVFQGEEVKKNEGISKTNVIDTLPETNIAMENPPC